MPLILEGSRSSMESSTSTLSASVSESSFTVSAYSLSAIIFPSSSCRTVIDADRDSSCSCDTSALSSVRASYVSASAFVVCSMASDATVPSVWADEPPVRIVPAWSPLFSALSTCSSPSSALCFLLSMVAAFMSACREIVSVEMSVRSS